MVTCVIMVIGSFKGYNAQRLWFTLVRGDKCHKGYEMICVISLTKGYRIKEIRYRVGKGLCLLWVIRIWSYKDDKTYMGHERIFMGQGLEFTCSSIERGYDR